MKHRQLLVLASLAVLTVGASETVDSWFRPPSEAEWPQFEKQGVDISPRIHEVIESKIPEAANLLQDNACVELTWQQVAAFINESPPPHFRSEPYLVRGLYGNRKTGYFSATYDRSHNSLLISHGSLGRTTSATRQPLVLFLEQKPEDVFVVVSIAE